MTDPDELRPPHLSERGWRTEPQPRTLDRPLPQWRRMRRADWLFIAVCLAGAAACIYMAVTR